MVDNEANPAGYQPLTDMAPEVDNQPDFNNPPLRRMRTSLVSRRRMAEM